MRVRMPNGILPALGPTIADWVAYGHAVQSAKDKSQFGKGDVRGVIAPETANNSVKGGDLVPTVAFGIPGSAAMAILLGAFLIQGLTPGPEMLTTKLHITFSMMWTLIFANIIGALLLMAWANQLQKIVFIPANLILPGITFFVLIGAWTAGNNIGDWITLLVFGAIGLVMKRAGWPRAPLILGFILGRIMENSLHISMQAYGIGFITRPICLALLAAIVITLFYAVRSHLRMKSDTSTVDVTDAEAGEPRLSLGLAIGICLLLVYAIATAFSWPPIVRLFPLAFSILGLLLALFAIYFDWRAIRLAPVAAAWSAVQTLELTRTLKFFGWLACIVIVTVLLGQHVAMPAFVLLYLLVWGGYGWKLALTYAAASLGILVLLFDYMSPTIWYPALLLRWW